VKSITQPESECPCRPSRWRSHGDLLGDLQGHGSHLHGFEFGWLDSSL